MVFKEYERIKFQKLKHHLAENQIKNSIFTIFQINFSKSNKKSILVKQLFLIFNKIITQKRN
jgi:hypothetical protein